MQRSKDESKKRDAPDSHRSDGDEVEPKRGHTTGSSVTGSIAETRRACIISHHTGDEYVLSEIACNCSFGSAAAAAVVTVESAIEVGNLSAATFDADAVATVASAREDGNGCAAAVGDAAVATVERSREVNRVVWSAENTARVSGSTGIDIDAVAGQGADSNLDDTQAVW